MDRIVKVIIPEEIYQKLEKEAQKRKLTVSELLSEKIEKEASKPQKTQDKGTES
jgi:post-segregation antitoxin (ccd killing protein)